MKYFRIFILTIVAAVTLVLLIEVIEGNTNCVYALVFNLVYVTLTINYLIDESKRKK